MIMLIVYLCILIYENNASRLEAIASRLGGKVALKETTTTTTTTHTHTHFCLLRGDSDY